MTFVALVPGSALVQSGEGRRIDGAALEAARGNLQALERADGGLLARASLHLDRAVLDAQRRAFPIDLGDERGAANPSHGVFGLDLEGVAVEQARDLRP